MPLVPEKLNSRQEVRNAITSQFWDQPVQSGRSVDGTARTHACEPPPAGQTAAGGLLRSQQLLVTQAACLPVMPGFTQDHGGVVSWQILHTPLNHDVVCSVCASAADCSTWPDSAVVIQCVQH